ncbi:MAG: hypothetical protein JSV37_15220 [Anaerolineaceae bacterium]|nr:MAG: hypothetical protein JSV37_15220 [Anaerolineaceae bacterium]
MEFSEEELEGFIKEFAKRRKRQIYLTLILLPLVFAYVFGRGDPSNWICGIPGEVYLLIFFILLIPAYINWSCPACKRMFGRRGGLNPTHCRYCGVPLRGDEPDSR